jgi:cyclic beta-1,2-glucan synthetase
LRRYKVEPYVIAADVYSVAPHVGRGGWTWYTGAAGWLYRAGVESILGFNLRGNHLLLTPCIPEHWPSFEMIFKHGSARYEILVENPRGVSRGIASTEVDGTLLAAGMSRIELMDDGVTHRVHMTLG